MFEVVSRKDAVARGLTYYFTAKPCAAGHIDLRYVSNWTCVLCDRLKTLAHGKKFPEKARARYLRWKERHPGKENENGKRWAENNRYRSREIKRRWKSKNKAHSSASTVKRLCAKKKRVPPWADLQKIQEFYDCARSMTEVTGESWHVDHVIPLQGKTVSGLHVHNNLQVIPGKENAKKGNRFNVESFGYGRVYAGPVFAGVPA